MIVVSNSRIRIGLLTSPLRAGNEPNAEFPATKKKKKKTKAPTICGRTRSENYYGIVRKSPPLSPYVYAWAFTNLTVRGSFKYLILFFRKNYYKAGNTYKAKYKRGGKKVQRLWFSEI